MPFAGLQVFVPLDSPLMYHLQAPQSRQDSEEQCTATAWGRPERWLPCEHTAAGRMHTPAVDLHVAVRQADCNAVVIDVHECLFVALRAAAMRRAQTSQALANTTRSSVDWLALCLVNRAATVLAGLWVVVVVGAVVSIEAQVGGDEVRAAQRRLLPVEASELLAPAADGRARRIAERQDHARAPPGLAVGKTSVILLHPPLPLVGVSIVVETPCTAGQPGR